MEYKESNTDMDLIELEYSAAKKLLIELFRLRNQITSTTITSITIVQFKQVVRGLISKYHSAGLLLDEDVTVEFGKLNKITFKYTPNLSVMVDKIINEQDQIQIHTKLLTNKI